MRLKIFSTEYIDSLVAQATESSRMRQHRNIHTDFSDPCQRLFNAIEPDSYIRPHMHGRVPRTETMIAVRGLIVLFTFDNRGHILETVPFGVDFKQPDIAVGVEIPPMCWHTVIAMKSGSVLLELKAGPFEPDQPTEVAPWAPEDGSADAKRYLQTLFSLASCHCGTL